MRLRRFILPCLFVFFGACLLSVHGHQAEKLAAKSEREPPPALDGAWELTGSVTDLKKFRTFKFVMINHGDQSYWVLPIRIGSMVKPQRMTVNADKRNSAIDFVSVDDNRTIRALYELSPDQLKVSWRGDRKTLIRPDKLLPVPDDCILHSFKRIGFADKGPGTKIDRRLMGIWETVAFETNGEILEKKDYDYSFEEKELALYIERDFCVIMSKEKNDLKVLVASLELKPKEGEQAIDIKYPDKSSARAIYSIIDDRMSICWNPNGPRPDQFITKQDDGRTLVRLRRVGSEGKLK